MATRQLKSALITGGTRGIGRAVALALADGSVDRLFLNYLENDEAANQIRLLLEAKNVTVHLLKFNLAFPNEVNALFEAVENATNHLDYFVHCAALTTFKPLFIVKSH